MPRYSPRVRPRGGFEGQPSTADRLVQAMDVLRRKNLREEQEQEREEQQGRQRELQDLELALRGVRRGEAPTRELMPDEDPLTAEPDVGGRPGMDARRRRGPELEVPSLFRGADRTRPSSRGVAGEGGDVLTSAPDLTPGRGRPPLAGALEQVRRQGPEAVSGPNTGEPELAAPPGAFVPGMGFTREPIYRNPQVDTRIGLQRPEAAEVDDPRFEQLTDEFYMDTDRTPEARRRRAQMEERGPAIEALARLRDATPDQLQALRAGVDPGVVFQDEGRQGFTAEELRRAGVSEDMIPAAMRDPTLARQLIGRDGGESDLGYQDRLEDLVESGVPRRRAEAIARDETAYRDFVDSRRGPSERDDYVGRRQRAFDAAKRILDLRTAVFGEGLEPNEEEIRRMNNEVRQTLSIFGYDGMDELQRDMRRYGLDESAVAEQQGAGGTERGEPGGPEGGDGTEPNLEADIRAALEEGADRQSILSELRGVNAPDSIMSQARSILDRLGGE